MKKYFFMRPVLRFIGEGGLFSRVFGSALRVFAVLITLGAVLGWVQLWKAVFEMNGTGMLGGILFQVFFAVGAYMVVHTFWIRAADIQNLGKSEFTVIPIVSIFLKLVGEIYACISLALGVGAGVLQLFAGYSTLAQRVSGAIPGIGLGQGVLSVLFSSDSVNTFISALILALSGFIAAVFWLVLFYMASELVVVTVDIARNTRELRQLVERRAEGATTGTGTVS